MAVSRLVVCCAVQKIYPWESASASRTPLLPLLQILGEVYPLEFKSTAASSDAA